MRWSPVVAAVGVIVSLMFPADQASTGSRTIESVGLLTAGSDECVATIVAPTLAVTTAHCLHDGNGRLRRADELRLTMSDGERFAIDRVRVDSGFAPYAPASLATIRRDLGCLHLRRARVSTARSLGAAPIPNEFLRLYRNSGASGEWCRVVLADSQVFTVDCAVGEGTSGAPLFRETHQRARLVGIVSAMETHQDTNGAIAVVPTEYCPSER